MTVLTIRAHRRYAVKRLVRLKRDGDKPVQGLIIEISVEGVRISNLGDASFEIDDPVTLQFSGGKKWTGKVRWAHGGLAGVRLDCALRLPELGDFLEEGRAPEYFPCYGT